MTEENKNTAAKPARTAVKKMTANEKRLISIQILKFRNMGFNLFDIAERMSISHTTAKKYLDDITSELIELSLDDVEKSREMAISSLDRIKRETNAKLVKIEDKDSKSYLNGLKLLKDLDIEICKLRGLYAQTTMQTDIGNLIIDMSSAEDKDRQAELMNKWVSGQMSEEIAEAEVRKQQELESKKNG